MVSVPGDKNAREQTAAPPRPGLGQGHMWPVSWEATEPGAWAQEAQLSAESEWDRHSEAWINLGACLLGLGSGEAGEGGVDGPFLFLCHCCGKGHRQDTGEPGPVGSLLPDSIEVCVRLCACVCVRVCACACVCTDGGRDRHGQVTRLSHGD